MRKTKKILSVALASTMVLSLAACGGKSTTETTQAAAETTAAAESSAAETTAEADGFNLAVCLASEPQTMDPALNSTVDGAIMTQHMFEGLAKYVNDGNGNAQIVAGQAESWEKVVNDDGTVTYTFKMRPDAKWSDGQKVTAGDFEYSWKRLANPQTAADYTYMIDMVKGYQEIQDGADPDTLAVKAIDDDTLEITLSYDCPYFEDVLAFPATLPVRQDVVEGNDEWTYDPSTYITNGAYKLVEWSHNAYILTEKNPEYYDYANLGPDTIKYTLLDDANAMLAAYKSGELQFIEQVPTDEIPNYLASGELQISDYIGTYYVCFNTEDEVFSNPLVRKAFSLAIDRNYIVEQVTQTGEVPASGFVPAGIYDAEGAGHDEIARNGWIADYNDPCTFLDMWYTGGGNNDAQYSRPEYDAAIDAAKATSVQSERMTAFHQAEDMLIGEDSVLAPIYFYVNKYMLDDSIDGMYYTPLGYYFFAYTSQK